MAIRKREEDCTGKVLSRFGNEGSVYVDAEDIVDSIIDLANHDSEFRNKLEDFIKGIIEWRKKN